MKRQALIFTAVTLVCFVTSIPMFAHHGRGGYDTDKTLTFKATITGFEWSNPHVQIHFDAPDEKGVIHHWTCEGNNPYSLYRNGWTKDTFRPGDQVTITFHPAKSSTGVGLLMSAITASGQKLTLGGTSAQ